MNCAVSRSVTALTLAGLSLSGGFGQGQLKPPLFPCAAEIGAASWYGRAHHGRPTASGEIYDMEQMTGAHRTLPFGTRVRVENLENHRSVDLRINDRGPFVDDRIIDVSLAGARVLGMLELGTTRVRVEVQSVLPDLDDGLFAVQVGAFRTRTNAERLQREMETSYGSAKILEQRGDPILWRVLAGRITSREDAVSLARRILAEDSRRTGDAFVIRLSAKSLRLLF